MVRTARRQSKKHGDKGPKQRPKIQEHQQCTVTMGDYYGSGGASKPQQSIDADKIFVGGLSWQTTEESLRYHFEQYGAVTSVEVRFLLISR